MTSRLSSRNNFVFLVTTEGSKEMLDLWPQDPISSITSGKSGRHEHTEHFLRLIIVHGRRVLQYAVLNSSLQIDYTKRPVVRSNIRRGSLISRYVSRCPYGQR